MNSLDVVLVVVVLAYAISGYVQGFVVNLVATAGLVLGGLGAIWLVPVVLGRSDPGLTTSLLALGMVVGAAAIGQAVGTYIGTDLRGGLRAARLRRVGGALRAAVQRRRAAEERLRVRGLGGERLG